MRTNISGGLAFSFFLAFLAGITTSIHGQDVGSTESIRIGLALPTQAEERWKRDKDYMVERAKELGIDLIVQISTNNQNEQHLNMEQLITRGVKVLIIAPHDSFGAAPMVELAHKSDIKVISYDRLIMNADVDLFVSFDNLKIGRMQGQYLVDRAPRGNYVIFGGPLYDSNARFYKQGAMAILQPYIDSGDITVVYNQDIADWDRSEVTKVVDNALAGTGNNVVAILTPNDGMAAGAIASLRQNHIAGKVLVTGQDGDTLAGKQIADGEQSMTVFKDVSREAEAALNASYLMATGKEYMTSTKGRFVNNEFGNIPAIILEPVLVDRDNVQAILYESGYIENN